MLWHVPLAAAVVAATEGVVVALRWCGPVSVPDAPCSSPLWRLDDRPRMLPSCFASRALHLLFDPHA